MIQSKPMSKRRQYLPIFLFLILTGLYLLFYSSGGTFQIAGNELGGTTYGHMWEQLIHGRFDMDPYQAVEVYEHDGKSYGYWGPLPALIHGILSPIWKTSTPIIRLTIILPMLLLLFGVWWTGQILNLHDKPVRHFFWALLACLAVGSPLFFTAIHPYIYNEAIIWACCLCIYFNLLFIRFIFLKDSRGPLMAILTGAVAGLTSLTRANTLVGPFAALVFAAFFLNWRRRKGAESPAFITSRHLVLAFLAFSSVLGLAFWVNYMRWGKPFVFLPIEYYRGLQQYKPWILNAFNNAGHYRLDRIPAALEYYFLPHSDNFSNSWPYLISSLKVLRFRPIAAHFADIEQFTQFPISLTSPFVAFFSILGVWQLLKALRKKLDDSDFYLLSLAGGYLVSWVVLFGMPGLNFRYQADLMPLLILLALLSLYFLKRTRSRILGSTGCIVASGILLVYSICATHIAAAQASIKSPGRSESKIFLMKWFGFPKEIFERKAPPIEAKIIQERAREYYKSINLPFPVPPESLDEK